MTMELSSLYWFMAVAALGMLSYCLWAMAQKSARNYQKHFERDLGRRLEEVFLFTDVKALRRAHTVAVVVLCVAIFLLSESPLAPLILALVLSAIPRIWLNWLKGRRIEKFRHQTPDALSLMAGGLKAGSSLSQMIAQAADRLPAPAGQEFAVMVRQQRMGSSLDQSLRDLAKRVETEETKLLVAAIQIGASSGGNTAEALESLAVATRRKIALEGKITALTAQGRLQAWVMAALPALLAAALFWIDPASMTKLFTTGLGWTVLTVVVVLQALGAWMIRKIVAIEV
jgi:tight adherence protein B